MHFKRKGLSLLFIKNMPRFAIPLPCYFALPFSLKRDRSLGSRTFANVLRPCLLAPLILANRMRL